MLPTALHCLIQYVIPQVVYLMRHAIEIGRRDMSKNVVDSLVNVDEMTADQLSYSEFCNVISSNVRVQDALWSTGITS
jgi:hypothetical protein